MQRYNDYVCIDLEMTGLSVRKREIIEFAAIKVRNGKIIDTMTALVKPKIAPEEKIMELTGITNEILKNEKGIEDKLPIFLNFIGEDILLGHNILFDYSFLKKASIDMDLEFEKKGIDTFNICKYLMPDNENKSLKNACEYYDIEVDKSHRAYADAYNTHLLYQKLLVLEAEDKLFEPKSLKYKYKKERLASNKEKEHLIKLLNYHKIKFDFEVDKLSLSELSRIRDNIILNYGKMKGKRK